MKRWVTDIICGLLIILWIYAAVSKLSDINVFTAQLKRQPLPGWATGMLVWALPAAELLIALLLSFIETRRYGLILSWILLACFTGYVALALSGVYGHIPCSCGGIFSFMQWKGHLIFNGIATIIAFAGWKISKEETSITVIHSRKYYAHSGKESENP